MTSYDKADRANRIEEKTYLDSLSIMRRHKGHEGHVVVGGTRKIVNLVAQ
jgi:hypothetical protein